jgi:hypothetical protein
LIELVIEIVRDAGCQRVLRHRRACAERRHDLAGGGDGRRELVEPGGAELRLPFATELRHEDGPLLVRDRSVELRIRVHVELRGRRLTLERRAGQAPEERPQRGVVLTFEGEIRLRSRGPSVTSVGVHHGERQLLLEPTDDGGELVRRGGVERRGRHRGRKHAGRP